MSSFRYATDCWEYDIKAAGKTFLEQKGFKLSDDKNEYVVQCGNIFKEHKDLHKEFYDTLKKILLFNLPPDVLVIRYYVDEIVVDRKLIWNNTEPFTIKEKHIKFILLEGNNFVKVYDDSIKISKGFKLQSPDLWIDIGNVMYDSLNRDEKHKRLCFLAQKFLKFRYDIHNYVVRSKKGDYFIVTNSLIIKIKDLNELPDISNMKLNEEFYYKFLFEYLHYLY